MPSDVETRLRDVEHKLARMEGAAAALRIVQVLVAIAVGGLAILEFFRGLA